MKDDLTLVNKTTHRERFPNARPINYGPMLGKDHAICIPRTENTRVKKTSFDLDPAKLEAAMKAREKTNKLMGF